MATSASERPPTNILKQLLHRLYSEGNAIPQVTGAVRKSRSGLVESKGRLAIIPSAGEGSSPLPFIPAPDPVVESTSSASKGVEGGRCTTMRLQKLDEQPEWAVDNPFILTGYRKCDQSWDFYLGSIFALHNETFNIW
jgi:hypothetical protein